MHTRRSFGCTLALAVSLLLHTPAAHAQLAPPAIVDEGDNGIFRIEFTTPNVFDLSSDWVSHDSSGRFSGHLRTTDGGEIDIDQKITGGCKTSRGVTTVKQKIKSFGTVGNGDLYSATSRYEGVMQGYGAGVQLIGVTKTHACLRYDFAPFSKKKVTVCTDSVLSDQVFTHDGRWSIRLGFDNAGKNLVGYATVYVAQGNPEKAKSYDTVVSGKVDPDGEANFKLKPLADSFGGTIKLRAIVIPRSGDVPPTLVQILEVGGNILGQKFAEVY